MSKRKPKTMSLMECRTVDDVCKLPRDNQTFGDYWIITDGYMVSLAQQEVGESATQKISIPRNVFNKMVRFYTRHRNVILPKPKRKARKVKK